MRNGATLVVASPAGTGLDAIAAHVVRYRAGSGSDVLRKFASGDKGYEGAREALDAGPVVGLVGRSSLAEDPMMAEAAAGFVRSLPDSKLLTLLTRANIYGALDMGLAPNLLPGRVSTADDEHAEMLEDAWGHLPRGTGRSTTQMLEDLASGAMRAMVLVGADPVRDCPDPGLASYNFV